MVTLFAWIGAKKNNHLSNPDNHTSLTESENRRRGETESLYFTESPYRRFPGSIKREEAQNDT